MEWLIQLMQGFLKHLRIIYCMYNLTLHHSEYIQMFHRHDKSNIKMLHLPGASSARGAAELWKFAKETTSMFY